MSNEKSNAAQQVLLRRQAARLAGPYSVGQRQTAEIAAIIAGAKDAADAEARLQLFYKHTGLRPANV